MFEFMRSLGCGDSRHVVEEGGERLDRVAPEIVELGHQLLGSLGC